MSALTFMRSDHPVSLCTGILDPVVIVDEESLLLLKKNHLPPKREGKKVSKKQNFYIRTYILYFKNKLGHKKFNL